MLILVPSVCLSSLWSMNFIGIAYKSLREGLYTGLSEPYHWLCLWRRHFFPSQKPFLPPFYMIEFRAAKICAVLIHVLWVQQCNGHAVPRKQFSTSFLGLQVLSSPFLYYSLSVGCGGHRRCPVYGWTFNSHPFSPLWSAVNFCSFCLSLEKKFLWPKPTAGLVCGHKLQTWIKPLCGTHNVHSAKWQS